MSARPKVAFFTAQDIGHVLAEFAASRPDLDCLFVTRRTLNDALNGYRDAAEACLAHRLECLTASRVDDAVIARLRDFGPDLLVSAYYPVILPEAILRLPRLDAVNVHPGLLPHYRGRFPTPYYILNGESHFGVALHRLDGGVDTGDVLVQGRWEIGADWTGHELYRQAMARAGEMVIQNLDALLAGALTPTPQSGWGSYYTRIESRFHIDWQASCETIARRVRVHARPYFPAYGFLKTRMVLINRARAAVPHADGSASGCGRIRAVNQDGSFLVECADGCLHVEDYEILPTATERERTLLLQPGNLLD